MKIQNSTSTFCITIPPALGKESSVNFGPLITEIKRWNRTHPNRLIRKTIFRPLGGAEPPNLENDQVLLAHLPVETGFPLTIFFKGRSKIGLKFNVLSARSLESGGVVLWNFTTWRNARRKW